MTRTDLIKAALATQDPIKLFSLFEKAIDLAAFCAAQAEFAKVREDKLKEQVKRQTLMIENMTKSLWSK